MQLYMIIIYLNINIIKNIKKNIKVPLICLYLTIKLRLNVLYHKRFNERYYQNTSFKGVFGSTNF